MASNHFGERGSKHLGVSLFLRHSDTPTIAWLIDPGSFGG